jgi:hypothetical protein
MHPSPYVFSLIGTVMLLLSPAGDDHILFILIMVAATAFLHVVVIFQMRGHA